MTNQTNWTEYTGSDEQIAELENAKNGFVVRLLTGREITTYWLRLRISESYWIIPDDPLREMKVRQAMTGQPVWVRFKMDDMEGVEHTVVWCRKVVNWNIPNAEYSFTEFKD